MGSRYVVGIDLGTTNSAIAFVDTEAEQPRIESLPIPQLTDPGEIGERAALPSFVYIAGEHDVRPGDLDLPWQKGLDYAVGELAREQGARVSGRMVSSAKSWLCHGGVDRQADILPWKAPEDVQPISPIEASSRFLQHLRAVWQQRFPDHPLDDQDVILTIPASFDEVARELTIEAAARAELHHARLLEEPQAAFYAWLEANEASWKEQLDEHRLALVIDVGGGTSDFSLIRIGDNDDEGTAALQRLAVGDHILLGGDNIDVALGRILEDRFGAKLDSQRWHTLVSLCRAAKEKLLGDQPPQSIPIQIGGRGSSLVAGTLKAEIDREQVEELVVDGFFPLVERDAAPQTGQGAGLQEWGLPYASDPALTRHLAAFLRNHADDPIPGSDDKLGFPDVILFNGGALKPPILRRRLAEQIGRWSDGGEPMVLATDNLDLAVSRGAAYFGMVRRGRGVRIGGGSPRAFYLGVEQSDGERGDDATTKVVCVAHRGLAEGSEITLDTPEFTVTTNQPCSFPLYASSTRVGDQVGAVLDAEIQSLSALPPVRTVLRFGKKLTRREIPARIVARLTDIGTMEIWLRSVTTEHQWRLQFRLQDMTTEEAPEEAPQTGAELELGEQQLEAARAALVAVFAGDADPVALTRALEEACGAGKDAWPLDGIRALWDTLWEHREARKRSQAHEARWLNLCGFLLRPGFGHGTDDWRIQQLWRLYSEGLRFPRAVQCRVEWWNLWKRIAGGLSKPQQHQLYQEVAPHLLTRLKSKRKSKSAVGAQEIREYWQLVASCEHLPATAKAELGATLLPAVARSKATEPEIWAFGRLGARAPFYGPLNEVVAKQEVEQWIEKLLERDWKRPQTTAFAAVQLARYLDDRDRDLAPELRQRLAEKLADGPNGRRAAQLVTEHVPLEAQERARILDESLPVGIRITST